MCKGKEGCQKADQPHEPSECSPEQIKECHGDVKEHPCEQSAEQK